MKDRKARIGPKIREALRLMIEDGRKRCEAAESVGLKDDSLYRALRRPEVLSLRSQLMEVLRTSEASRTIARVATLADSAESEHVKMAANEWLAGIAGEGPITRSQSVVYHEHHVPGLTVIFSPPALPGDDAIDITPPQIASERAKLIASLPKLVPHPGEGKS